MIHTSDSLCEKEVRKYFEVCFFSNRRPAAERPITPTFGGRAMHSGGFLHLSQPLSQQGFFVLAHVAPPFPATHGQSIPFFPFFLFNSLFFLHQESAMIILLSAETDRRSLLLLSIRPRHPVCPRLQFFSFLPPWKKKINSLVSRLLLSQRQAGLGVPSRSDRSLITATVSRGGDGGGGGGVQEWDERRGGERRGGEGRCKGRED